MNIFTLRNILASTAILSLIAVSAWYLAIHMDVFGSSPGDVATTIATSTNFIVVKASRQLFATSTCSARIISTVGEDITILFGTQLGNVPSATLGHVQFASTTVTYPAENFGCGTWNVFGQSIPASPALTSITITETQ